MGEEIKYIATVAAGNDEQLGELVASAILLVGCAGAVVIKESNSRQTKLTKTDGMGFEQGFVSPYFITEKKKGTVTLHEPFIFLTEVGINHVRSELIPLLSLVKESGRPLLIIAPRLSQDVLATLITNKIRGKIIAVPVKTPGYGIRRQLLLQDLAFLTGGKVVSPESGDSMLNMKHEYLGQCQHATIGADYTTI